MDIWMSFIQTANDILTNASIVQDLLYLVKYLNETIDKVRRMKVKLHQELKHSWNTLLKNPKNLTEKQRIHFELIHLARR